MTSNVEVRITADVIDLQSKVAVAKATMKDFGDSSRLVAKQIASEGWTSDLTAKMRDVSKGYLTARAEVDGLRSSVDAATGHVDGLREIGRAMREIGTGDVSHLPQTVAMLANSVGELGPVGIAAAAGVTALAGGIAYLAYQEIEADKTAQHMAEGFALSGRGAVMTADAVKGEIAQLAELPGVTQKAAQAIVEWEAAHGAIDARINNAVDQLLPQYVAWLGEKAPEAVAELKTQLSDIASGALEQASAKFEQMNKTMLHLPPAQQEIIEGMIESGDRTAAVNRIVADLAQQGGGHVDSLKAQIVKLSTELNTAKVDALALETAMGQGIEESSGAYVEAAARVDQLAARLRALQAAANLQTAAPQLPLSDLDKYTARLRQQADLAGENARARAVDSALIEAATDKLRDQGQAEMQVVTSAAQARQILGSQADVVARLAAATADAKQGFRDQAKEARQAFDEIMRQSEESSREEIRAATQAWQEQKSIDQDNVRTSVEITKIGLEQKKQILEQEVADGRITNAQKIAQLQEYASEAAALDVQVLQSAIYSGNLTVLQAAEDSNKIKVIQAQLAVQLASIATEGAKQQSQAWQQATAQIASSEDNLVRNIFSKRQSLNADLFQLGSQLVQKEIADDVKLWTEKGMIAIVGQGKIKATEQGGLLMQILFDQQDVASTVAAEGEKTAAAAAGSAAGKAVAVTAAVQQVATNAAVAASGAMAATAMIPYVGPAMAPGVAAATYAETMGFAGMATAEGGQYMVAADGQLTELHKREMVLPAPIADQMRAVIANGPRGFDGNLSGGFNFARMGDTNIGGNTHHEEHHYGDINYSPSIRTNDSMHRAYEKTGADMVDQIARQYRAGRPMRSSGRTI